MEETLGKRIVSNRKRLGLTQDQLAEQLGVTAQAVSKWENDQSCPDISILPRLADIFSITTDVLLGRAPQQISESAVIPEEPLPVKAYRSSTKRTTTGIAIWILLVGAQLLAAYLLGWEVSFRALIWPTGLLVFGMFGLYPRFSFFRLGCVLLGAFWILNAINAVPFFLSKELLLAAFLLLAGLSLLMDSLCGRKHVNPHGHIFPFGSSGEIVNQCSVAQERFDCTLTFGEESHNLQLPRLSGGDASVAFGNLTMDLTCCGDITDKAPFSISCAFGTLEFRVPRWCRVDLTSHKAFGVVEIKGAPDSVPKVSILLDARVSFGEISIRYI